ncbi:MAG TPA: outer membrane lipoprotein carrier protein LolA [Ferruginibacter sp.]|jgi:outer membrane lipoprotein carrier protein|nr:outer membrane lipoprotein carrier protein LolA [Ferruginibacter sp.]
MKKILSSLFFLTILISSVSAQGKNDPDAKKLLDAVTTKFKSFKSLQAKFTLKIENAAGKTLGSKTGTVYMKGLKYRIDITGQNIYCDGVNVSTYDPSSKELTVTKVDPSSTTLTPQKVFTDFYDKDFLYKLNDDRVAEGKTIQEVELTPTDKTKTFFKVLVDVDKSTHTIVSTKIFEKTGERYTYSLSNMNTTILVPDNVFVFDEKKYPDTEVVDLR